MVFAGYCRVSLPKDTSIDIQKEEIKKYLSLYFREKQVVFFVDNGLSAYRNRPGFNRMMKKIDKYDGVIVSDITRFGRETMDLLHNIRKLEESGKVFITVRQRIDTTTKEGKLLLTMLSAIADFERSSIRERLIAGQEYARLHGTKSGKPLHRPKKPVDLSRMVELRTQGLSVAMICKELGISKPTYYSRLEDIEKIRVAKKVKAIVRGKHPHAPTPKNASSTEEKDEV